MWFTIRFVRAISREKFSPRPKVDSALVYIDRKQKPLVAYAYHNAVFGLVEYALRQPDAPIDVALSGVFTKPQLKQLKRALRMGADDRIGTLSEAQWGVVFATMVQYVKRPLWPRRRKERFK